MESLRPVEVIRNGTEYLCSSPAWCAYECVCARVCVYIVVHACGYTSVCVCMYVCMCCVRVCVFVEGPEEQLAKYCCSGVG